MTNSWKNNTWDYEVGDLLHINFHGRKTEIGTITRKGTYQCTRFPFPHKDKWEFQSTSGNVCTLIGSPLTNTKTITVLSRGK